MPWKCSTKGEGRNQAIWHAAANRAYWDQVNTASRNEQDVAPIKSRYLPSGPCRLSRSQRKAVCEVPLPGQEGQWDIWRLCSGLQSESATATSTIYFCPISRSVQPKVMLDALIYSGIVRWSPWTSQWKSVIVNDLTDGWAHSSKQSNYSWFRK